MAFQAYFRRKEQESNHTRFASNSSSGSGAQSRPRSNYVVEITAFQDDSNATESTYRPPEYRRSYNSGGVLPGRVLHLKSASSTRSTSRTAEYGLEQERDLSTPDADKDLEKDGGIAREIDVTSYDDRALVEKELEGAVVDPKIAAIDPNIVDWDGPDDPDNPQNWSAKRKWGTVAIISFITFLTPLASTMFAPGVPELMADFHNSNTELAGFVVSVYIVGYVVGPLIIAPLSELYGRRIIFNVTNVMFIGFMIGCGRSTNIGEFIAFRFLTGCMGSTPITVGGGVIADIMPQERRGGAMAIWAMGPIIGPIIGPVAGGYAAASIGWRWIFYIISMAAAVCGIATAILFKETYAPRILALRTRRLRKDTGNPNLRSRFDNGQSPSQLFKKAIVRPMKMLFLSPIVFLLSLFMAICYGYLYLLFATFTYVFEEIYHFTPGSAGLAYLGIGIGSMIGLVITGIMSDRIVKRMSAKGIMKPEYRLPPLIPAAICLPIGLFVYGWTTYYRVHWIVPIIGTGIFGLGLLGAFMPVATYLIDAWPLYAASSTAASTVLRSLFGAILPLAGQQMYAKLGLGWGNSVLGFIALAMVPVPFVFLKFGERIRMRFPLNL